MKRRETSMAIEPLTRHKPWISPAAPAVLTSLSRSVGFVVLAVVSAGVAFEFEYFRELSLRSFDYLDVAHFVMSGLSIVWFPVAVVTVWAMAKKLFSRSTAEDDWVVVRECLSRSSFAQEVWCARAAVLGAFAIYVSTRFGLAGPMYAFAMFCVVLLFARAALLSPEPARVVLLFWFFISWMVCAGAGGIYEARAAMSRSPVRDDPVVTIEYRVDHYLAVPKPQNWACIPWVTKIWNAAKGGCPERT